LRLPLRLRFVYRHVCLPLRVTRYFGCGCCYRLVHVVHVGYVTRCWLYVLHVIAHTLRTCAVDSRWVVLVDVYPDVYGTRLNVPLLLRDLRTVAARLPFGYVTFTVLFTYTDYVYHYMDLRLILRVVTFGWIRYVTLRCTTVALPPVRVCCFTLHVVAGCCARLHATLPPRCCCYVPAFCVTVCCRYGWVTIYGYPLLRYFIWFAFRCSLGCVGCYAFTVTFTLRFTQLRTFVTFIWFCVVFLLLPRCYTGYVVVWLRLRTCIRLRYTRLRVLVVVRSTFTFPVRLRSYGC